MAIRKSGSVRWVPREEWVPQALAEEKAKREAEHAAWREAHPWLLLWWQLGRCLKRLVGR